MPKTVNVPDDSDRKSLKMDVRTVIIVTILAFAGGVLSANQQPSYATTDAPAVQSNSTTAQASSGK